MGVVCGVQGMPPGPSHLTGTYLHPGVWVKPQSPSWGSPPRSLSPIGQPLGHLPGVWVPSSYMTRPAHHRAPRSPDEPTEANMGVHPCLETATEGVIAKVMPWPLWSHGATWWPLPEWLSILASWVTSF